MPRIDRIKSAIFDPIGLHGWTLTVQKFPSGVKANPKRISAIAFALMLKMSVSLSERKATPVQKFMVFGGIDRFV
jgi:hypothetical protein